MVYLLCQANCALATTEKSGSVQSPLVNNSGTTIDTGQYLQMLLALLFIIGLIFMIAWAMRRMGNMPGASRGALRVLTGVSLGQRERVVLMQAGKTQLLLGVAPGQIRTLHVFDEPVIEADEKAEPVGFAERLNTALKQRIKP